MKPEYEDELMADYRKWKKEREALARQSDLFVKAMGYFLCLLFGSLLLLLIVAAIYAGVSTLLFPTP